jgi:hypothetical protein
MEILDYLSSKFFALMNNKLATLIMKDELILVTKRMAWNKALSFD